ncbi:DUF411 domain-containing protein [Psychrobacter ciconiae]|uniref:DUF411 domain-containing protein n=1 Tax=Psychrobacter ciconiae TaxID=1553449 RepID=UPI001918C08E|nr:DUF411 domain-containing protein [Psychrobacter ciconiae]
MTTFIRPLKQCVFSSRKDSQKIPKIALMMIVMGTLAACNPSTSTADPASNHSDQVTKAHSVTEKGSSDSNSALLKNASATVYKDANCGCCKDWISHVEGHGLTATSIDVADMRGVKERYDVPNDMQSCHTAVTSEGYVFEGHVPAKFVAQFLARPPENAIGLAVPDMPLGSPGMEYQNQFEPYQVMQLNKDGSTKVFANIESAQQQL